MERTTTLTRGRKVDWSAFEASGLKGLIGRPEGPDLEFKSSVPPVRVLADNLAALANTRGGLLVLGVDESNGSPAIRGVDSSRVEKALANASRLITPQVTFNGEAVEVDGKVAALSQGTGREGSL